MTAVSPTDIWAAGTKHTSLLTPIILHYDGVSWTQVKTAHDPNSEVPTLTAITHSLATFAAGWRLDELRAFDAFPMTHHVECVAALSR